MSQRVRLGLNAGQSQFFILIHVVVVFIYFCKEKNGDKHVCVHVCIYFSVTALGASELHQPQHVMINEVQDNAVQQKQLTDTLPPATATRQYLQHEEDQKQGKGAATSGAILADGTILQQGTFLPEGTILPEGSVIVPTADGSLIVTDGKSEEQRTFSQTSTSVIQAEQQIPDSLLVNDDVTTVAFDQSKVSLATYITNSQQQSSEDGQIISFDTKSEHVILEQSSPDENADNKTKGDTIIIATIEKKSDPTDSTHSEEITHDTTVHVTIEKQEQSDEKDVLEEVTETALKCKPDDITTSVKQESKVHDVLNSEETGRHSNDRLDSDNKSVTASPSKACDNSDTDITPAKTRSETIKPKRQLISRFKRKQPKQKKSPVTIKKTVDSPNVGKGTRKSVRKGALPKKLSDSVMPTPKKERTISESKVEIELHESEKELFKKTKEELDMLNSEAAVEEIPRAENTPPKKKLKTSRTPRSKRKRDKTGDDEDELSKEERKLHRVECMICSSMLRDYAGVHDHLKSRHAEHPDFEKHLQEAKVDFR